MRRHSALLFLLPVLVALSGGLLSGTLWPIHANGQPWQDSSVTSVPIYVSDFELFSSATSPQSSSDSDSTKKSGGKGGPVPVFSAFDAPSIQARRLMDFFTLTLLEKFKTGGYTSVHRQGQSPADKGVLLRGVFAEPDAKNRIRRAMLGGGSPGATMLLYVGTFNLARPTDPLYLAAMEQNPDSRYGPIITVNNYIPMVKFELSKNPTEEEVQKISTQIVQNLSTLLQANPAAFNQ
jgi:Domain of unknown function (DUF4410)